ncbi:MAG: shikimate kinase [Bacteroidia bacterium]
MRIYLLGYMGSGKSIIGDELAGLLKYKFIDLDEKVSKAVGLTIPHIFEVHGENYFRQIEKEQLHKTVEIENAVIATGGGTPNFFDNMKWMNLNGTTVYLKMNPGILFRRLAFEKQERPRIKDLTDIELMEQIVEDITRREHVYMKAQHIIEDMEVTSDNIVKMINNKESKK